MDMTSPNLFRWATSELSQDAVLLWLLQWADPRYQQLDKELNRCSQRFLRLLIGKDDGFIINSIKLQKQTDHIDIFITVNDDIFLLIEDKTGTKDHSNQLSIYKGKIEEKFREKSSEIHCVYVKTGNESLTDVRRIEEKEHYKVVLRRDIINSYADCKTDNIILEDFLNYLLMQEQRTEQFKSVPWKEWGEWEWQGFYLVLQEWGIILDWGYIHQVGKGFMGAWTELIPVCPDNSFALKLQFEGDSKEKCDSKLCVKLCGSDSNMTKECRIWRDRILSKAKTEGINGIHKPKRLGKGVNVTVAYFDLESILGDSTINNIKDVEDRFVRILYMLMDTISEYYVPSGGIEVETKHHYRIVRNKTHK